MMRVTVLGSGSRGNAILVDGSEGAVLIDAGFGRRTLARRFAVAGRRPEEVASLLLTHEHVDHARGATAACQQWGWPVVALSETHQELAASAAGAPPLRSTLDLASAHEVAGFTVTCTSVPHDARRCAALVLTDRSSGARLGIALDLGHVPEHLPAALSACDLLVLESNHDERLLAQGPYPWSLKQRVGGRLGHLSNGAAAALLAGVSHRGLRGVILAHLSETNNSPTLALSRSRDALRRAGWQRESLFAAAQDAPSAPLDACARVWTGAQLTLDL